MGYVKTTEIEYDAAGRIVKETVTETEIPATPKIVQPQPVPMPVWPTPPYRYYGPYWGSISSGVTYTVNTVTTGKHEGPDGGVPAKV